MTPNRVTIDLEAIRHNYRRLKKLAGPQAGVVAVIKSDAYGHGMIPVARALEDENPPFFAVFEIEEAIALRDARCLVPILILLGVSVEDAPAAVAYGFTVSLFRMDVATALSQACVQQKKSIPVHIKVDTGMTRLGVPWEAVYGFLQNVGALRGLRLEGIFSHLAVSDELQNPFTDEQVRRFSLAVEQARKLGTCTKAVHLANSGAVLRNIGTDLDLVRPGIALYGSPPLVGLDGGFNLKPAMAFTSRVVRVQQVGPRTPVSYGCTYITDKTTTIATVPVGYDDGFNRLFSNRGEVLIRGQRAPVVGRVCMNLTMVDVSSIQGVCVDDEVVLLGAQGNDRITAEDWAAKLGTISYEVYCSVGKSNRRAYKGAQVGDGKFITA